MKKIIIVAIAGLTIGAISSPVIGMAIGSTRNLILGMAPDEAILTLADRIDAEAVKNSEQDQQISELQKENSQVNEQDSEEENQESEAEKQERIRLCENKRKACQGKISPLEAEIEKINKKIKGVEDDEADYRKEQEKCRDNDDCTSSQKRDIVENILKTQKSKLDLQQDANKVQDKINQLTGGECENYQNPC